MARKPQAGSCGRCGRAVVRPTREPPAYGDVWLDGHRYVDGKLVEVKCVDHEPRDGWS